MTETTRPSRLASAVGKLNGLTPDEVAELDGTKVASLTAQARQIVDRRAYIERNRQHRPHVPLDVLAEAFDAQNGFSFRLSGADEEAEAKLAHRRTDFLIAAKVAER